MNRLTKISIITALGGTFIGEYLWLNESNQAWATTSEQEMMRRAAIVPTITSLLLDNDFDFNDVPAAQTVDEDTLLEFSALNNNLVSVTGTDIASCKLSVNHGVLSISINAGLITQGLVNTSSFTISGTPQQINDALATLSYEPNADFNGTDLLTIITSNSNGDHDTDTVSIVVNPTDDGLPDAVNDDFTTPFNAQLTGNVLDNDTLIDEADVDPVNNAATSQGGSISIGSDGEFTYTPPNGFANTDTFVYILRDADDQTDTATVTIEPSLLEVVIADNNGAGVVGDESIIENLTLTNGAFTIVTAAGLASGVDTALLITHEDGDTFGLTLAQLNNLTTVNQQLGTNTGNILLTAYDNNTGVVNYEYDPVGTFQDHSGGDFGIIDSFSITATDSNADSSAPEPLEILIVDTSPVANNDTNDISEGTSAIAGNAVGFISSASGDVTDTIVDPNANPVTDIDFGGTDGTVGTPLAGELGTLVFSSNGVYTYTLDNTNPTVQGLKAGEHETEVFTYTITDGDSDTDTATITVTINGVEDAAPTIVIPDADGSTTTADQSLIEASGSTVNGTITVTASSGIDELTIDDQDLTNATASNVTVNGSEGALIVSSFDTSTGVISYSFTEDGNAESHNSANDNVGDAFTISVVDNEGDSATNTLDILILDTSPTAASDQISVTEDDTLGNPAVGDVISNDTSGADTAISVVGVDFNGVAQIVGQTFDSDFGTLDLNADGTYTYTLDNSNPLVQALDAGFDTLFETFTYTIVDTDGDQSSTLINVAISGVDELDDIPTLIGFD